jgi:hypothetical protein
VRSGVVPGFAALHCLTCCIMPCRLRSADVLTDYLSVAEFFSAFWSASGPISHILTRPFAAVYVVEAGG